MENSEIGCYGDGANGHQYTRNRCAGVLEYYLDANFRSRGCPTTEGSVSADDLIMALRDEMSDDAWEEDSACNWLNTHAPFDCAAWGWQDGDFGLWIIDDTE